MTASHQRLGVRFGGRWRGLDNIGIAIMRGRVVAKRGVRHADK